MPTVLRIGPYRFFFYSNEGREPAHIHVQSGDGEAKFWLEPVGLVWSRGYNRRQTNDIQGHIEEHIDLLLSSWMDYFGDGRDD